jgi:hypothetical protein
MRRHPLTPASLKDAYTGASDHLSAVEELVRRGMSQSPDAIRWAYFKSYRRLADTPVVRNSLLTWALFTGDWNSNDWTGLSLASFSRTNAGIPHGINRDSSMDSISGMLGGLAACLTCWFGDSFKDIATAAMGLIDDWEGRIQAAATLFIFYAFNRAIAAAMREILKAWRSTAYVENLMETPAACTLLLKSYDIEKQGSSCTGHSPPRGPH